LGQSWKGHFGEEKMSFPYWDSKPKPFSLHPSCCTNYPTPAPYMLLKKLIFNSINFQIIRLKLQLNTLCTTSFLGVLKGRIMRKINAPHRKNKVNP
jgi:hypothetical protein